MRAYIFGAGASVSAGYPLASQLLHGLSAWLDRCDTSVHWVPWARNRIVQVRETFGSLDDFEGILGKLEEFGQRRVSPPGPTTYRQDLKDILHDYTEGLRGVGDADTGGFYPQYLRSDLILALREFFYQTEQLRTEPNAYESFAVRKACPHSSVITFNYDIALERALAKAGKWDIGDGYGFQFLPDRLPSGVTVYKLHGSVNWFKEPINNTPPPVIFTRDLELLGYKDLVDRKVGGDGMGVEESGTLILPDPRKRFYWAPFWEPLWNGAAERLRAANEVLIHGYSMPTTDIRARQLLFENIPKSAAISIHCRSASERIVAEFRSRGFEDLRPFQSVDFEAWAVSDPSWRITSRHLTQRWERPPVKISDGDYASEWLAGAAEFAPVG
ncbi:MAG: SIR2 family protein, partial [Acidobacteria bacterium]|nr:SIR2 family protein [Acidobacteriota bacterium]